MSTKATGKKSNKQPPPPKPKRVPIDVHLSNIQRNQVVLDRKMDVLINNQAVLAEKLGIGVNEENKSKLILPPKIST